MRDIRAKARTWHEGRSVFRVWVHVVFVFLAIFLAVTLAAQDVPIPEAPTQWVTDNAGFLSTSDIARINGRLRAYEEQTQHQLIVWIGTTTGEVPIEDWANRAFEKWRVGRDGIDDGLVLFIMANDRRLRIEVGYGLEPDVPDLLAKRIIDEIIVPRIRAGDNTGAVEAGMEAVAQAIGQNLPGASVAGQTAPRSQPSTLGGLITFIVFALIALAIFGSSPGLALWLLASLVSGGRGGRRGGWGGGGFGGGGGWGGGGFGGGGGFSGGGGMSGGGGASGSW